MTPPARPLASTRHTVVVPNHHAFERERLSAARDRAHGRQLMTIEQLVARLAGPFLRAPDTALVRGAVARARGADLGDLARIASLPGFVRAAADALHAAWEADLDPSRPPSAHPRWHALAALETVVREAFPGDVALPRELARAALERSEHARALLGAVTLLHVDDIAPCWRPVLRAVAERVPVTWVRLDPEAPAWVPPAVTLETVPHAQPRLERVACATPAAEALEALRWSRSLIASGEAEPGEVAIVAASPSGYDAHLLAAARAAGLPLHPVHGVPLAETAAGQTAAALADALVRGVSTARVRRVVEQLQAQLDSDHPGHRLTSSWWARLGERVPLTTVARWQRAVAAAREDGGDEEPEATAWLLRLVDVLARGPAAAAEVGESYLGDDALVAWRRALDDGPPDALDVTLARLRTRGECDPVRAIVWGPAEVLSFAPRPFVRMLGLSARSWPRRPKDDPLLPEHVLGGQELRARSLAERDRRAFGRLLAHVRSGVVLSRARRDEGGRVLVASPLLAEGEVAAIPEHTRLERSPPAHALDEADRLAARPDEAARDGRVRDATDAYRARRDGSALTPHDGLVRAGHPALTRALMRLHSATSLRQLLRDPLGFTWRYALRFEEPPEAEEPFSLEPRDLGTLVHTVLEGAVRELESRRPGGFASADDEERGAAVDAALARAAAAAEHELATPPALAWRRVQADVRQLALRALSLPLPPLPDQRSYVELRFGDRRARPDPDAPWNPRSPVPVPGTELRLRGVVDRLDLSGDGSRARVVDYKTGRAPSRRAAGGLQGGQELQRCIYALAVHHLLDPSIAVEALLLHPREGSVFALDDPDGAASRLTAALAAAADALRAGTTVPGPDAFAPHNELRFALPADAARRYRERKEPLVHAALPELATLWSET
jgi:RecB family exonuclease